MPVIIEGHGWKIVRSHVKSVVTGTNPSSVYTHPCASTSNGACSRYTPQIASHSRDRKTTPGSPPAYSWCRPKTPIATTTVHIVRKWYLTYAALSSPVNNGTESSVDDPLPDEPPATETSTADTLYGALTLTAQTPVQQWLTLWVWAWALVGPSKGLLTVSSS